MTKFFKRKYIIIALIINLIPLPWVLPSIKNYPIWFLIKERVPPINNFFGHVPIPIGCPLILSNEFLFPNLGWPFRTLYHPTGNGSLPNDDYFIAIKTPFTKTVSLCEPGLGINPFGFLLNLLIFIFVLNFIRYFYTKLKE